MSFDSQLFDDGLFGSLDPTAIFDGAIFDSQPFDTGSDVPPPTPPAQSFFGGGPFRRRKWRLEEEEVREELPEPQAVIVEQAIERAVEAIQSHPKPEPIVLDAQRIYERVFLSLRGELRESLKESLQVERIERKRIEKMWRAEVEKRVRQQEEELMIFLISL